MIYLFTDLLISIKKVTQIFFLIQAKFFGIFQNLLKHSYYRNSRWRINIKHDKYQKLLKLRYKEEV